MAVDVVSSLSFMELGLEMAGFKHWRSYKEKGKVERFRSLFGAAPTTCETIWADLQVTGHLTGDENRLGLLLALRFLKAYPTEKELSGMFQMSDKIVRKWVKVYVRKIQRLKFIKVSTMDIIHIFCTSAVC
jgi:hypothetical protein